MPAELTLDLPWVEAAAESIDGLIVRRGRSALAYDDGIVLAVQVIDPTAFGSAAELVEAANASRAPGQVVLVAGVVPLGWRSQLREADISFVDVSGVAEIKWPRLQISARRFGKPIQRQRSALSFQKGHSLVVEELLIISADGAQPRIGELADAAGVSLSTASRAVSQLAAHGLVTKRRDGVWVSVDVIDRVGLAKRLAERTAWPADEMLTAYMWGRTILDVAARVSNAAARAGIDLAVTGRVGAWYYGVLGTSASKEVRCWVDTNSLLAEVAGVLGLDPAPRESANVLLSADPWRIGTHRRQEAQFDELTASVAHPLRVWCDLHGEKRGAEYAAQMWGAVVHGR